jgi:hypothetical protein
MWLKDISRLLVIALMAVVVAHAQATKPQATKPLTNDDILDFVKSGLTGESIVSIIAASDTAFDTSPEAIANLRNSGVTQRVTDAMLAAEAKKNATQAPAAGGPLAPAIPRIDTLASLSVQARAIPAGSRFFVAPIPSGFDKFLLVSFFQQKLPLIAVSEKGKADYEVSAFRENANEGVKVVEAKSGDVIFACYVPKGFEAFGKEHEAKACAKQLREQMQGTYSLPPHAGLISPGSKVVFSHMEEFEYAIRVGMNNKHVPLVSAEDRDHADFEFTGAYDTQTFGKAAKVGKTVCYVTAVFAVATPPGGDFSCELRPVHEIALIMTDLKSGQVIFARQTYRASSMAIVAEEFADFLNHAIQAK